MKNKSEPAIPVREAAAMRCDFCRLYGPPERNGGGTRRDRAGGSCSGPMVHDLGRQNSRGEPLYANCAAPLLWLYAA